MKERREQARDFVVSADSMASSSHPQRNDDKVLGRPDNRYNRPENPGLRSNVEYRIGKEQELAPKLEELNVYGLFDGISLARGDVASRTASSIMTETMTNLEPGATAEESLQAISEGLRKAHEACKTASAGSTADIVRLLPGEGDMPTTVVFGHVGDSRIYKRNQEGRLERITIDQNRYNQEIEIQQLMGNITPEQASAYRLTNNFDDLDDAPNEIKIAFMEQHVLTSSLGGNYEPKTGQFDLQEGESIVIVSDGVHDNMTDQEIAEELDLPGDNPAERLNIRAMEKARRLHEHYHRKQELEQEKKELDELTAQGSLGKAVDLNRFRKLKEMIDSKTPADLKDIKGYDDMTSVIIESPPQTN